MVKRGQALVEFALVAPVLVMLILLTVDAGRMMFVYSMLQGSAQEIGRQAVLRANQASNTALPSCTALVPPCPLGAVVDPAHQLDVMGMNVVYANSGSVSSPPAYGTFTPNADPTLPGTIALTGAATPGNVYVFIYEIDTQAFNPNPRWPCLTAGCVAANGPVVRTSGHQLVVVDLKFIYQPVISGALGINFQPVFDAQSVERMEF